MSTTPRRPHRLGRYAVTAVAAVLAALAAIPTTAPTTAAPAAGARAGAALVAFPGDLTSYDQDRYGDLLTAPDPSRHGPATAAATVGTLPPLPCSTTRTGTETAAEGARIEVLYVTADGYPDRHAAVTAAVNVWARAADRSVAASAAKTGGARHLRYVTTPRTTTATAATTGRAVTDCDIPVPTVRIDRAALAGFDTTIAAVADAGWDDPHRLYMLITDDGDYDGLADAPDDTRRGPTSPYAATQPLYAALAPTCWDPDGTCFTHELVHLLGAVQPGAPHVTGGGHCFDGPDLMCYDDHTAHSGQHAVCEPGDRLLLDCGNDDYFSTAPKPGTYLATHWNGADSPFLDRAPLTGDAGHPWSPLSLRLDGTPENPGDPVSPAWRDGYAQLTLPEHVTAGAPFALDYAVIEPVGVPASHTWALSPGCRIVGYNGPHVVVCDPGTRQVTAQVTVSAPGNSWSTYATAPVR